MKEAAVGTSQSDPAFISQTTTIDEESSRLPTREHLVSPDRDPQIMALATPSGSAVLADRRMSSEHVNPSAAAAGLVEPGRDAQSSQSVSPPPCLDDLLAAVKPFTSASETASTTWIGPSLAVTGQQPGTGLLDVTSDALPRNAHERDHEFPKLNSLLELDREDHPSAVDGNHSPESQQPDPIEIAELAAQEIIAEARQASAENLVAENDMVSKIDSTLVSPLRFEDKARTASSDGTSSSASESRQHDREHDHCPALSATHYQPSSSVIATMVPDGLCTNDHEELVTPFTKTAQELDAAEYVIKNYYPSNGTPCSTRQGSPAQLDYPLRRQLSLRRGGSLERPTLPSQADQAWRYSDSSTTLQPRSIPSSGGPTPLVERKLSWHNAANSTPSVITTRANPLNLSSHVPPSVGNPERSANSGHETTGVSDETPSESLPAKVSPGAEQHPLQLFGSDVHRVLAPTPRRSTADNISGHLKSERPALVSERSSRFSALKVRRIYSTSLCFRRLAF